MDAIFLRGVRTHNLKGFDLILPHRKLYVITGVSGSGKSSLAFDTLYAEGQRRYVESLSSYARQFLERMEKPDIEGVSGIPPAIAIQSKNSITNARSTVGTQTEINDYLRLFFARAGRIYCPDCGSEVTAHNPASIANQLLSSQRGHEVVILFELPLAKKGNRYLKEFLPELDKQGFVEYFVRGKVVDAEGVLKHQKSLSDRLAVCADRLKVDSAKKKRLVDSLELAFRYGQGTIQVKTPDKLLQYSEGLRCSDCGKAFREPVPNLFSFNSPLGACGLCQGFGRTITLDWNLIIPDEGKSIIEGVIEPWTKPSAAWHFEQLLAFCKKKKISVTDSWRTLSAAHRESILRGAPKTEGYFSVKDYFDYLGTKTYKMHVRIFLSKYRGYEPCPECHESRLKPEALCVRVAGTNIADLMTMTVARWKEYFQKVETALKGPERERVEPVYLEIKKRIEFLDRIGLGYLSLARLSRTLSGGELQRIHLATSLGSALVDTLYVLDEPSIGLHERDNGLLIRQLKQLRDLGNTVVVVEHDRTMIEAADEVLDMGPAGGENGGRVLFQGPIEKLANIEGSLTGRYLSGELAVSRSKRKQPKTLGGSIRIRGAREHNLKDLNVEIPLQEMVVLTGVSGSGKSTLLYDVLYHHFLRFQGKPVQDLGKVDSVDGFENVDQIGLIDQSPIGRTPRSNPVTYMKAFDEIRKLFGRTCESQREGFTASHFSFNVDGGRCARCKGEGQIKVEMHFLADVFVRCEECEGKRFRPEVLEIKYEGKNIDDVLAMTIDEAAAFFSRERLLIERLEILQKVGLGYLRLGQSATTLSGGEAQRLKIAFEMTQQTANHILYLFDEPTSGLHYHDIQYLMQALDELLERGHSLLIIEHNMEVIRSADFVIDLGPEGGDGGGHLVYSGPLAGLENCPNSFTGQYLKEYKRRAGAPKATYI
ncbi:MAG: excinuclease ABC subunit UvrA [Candidatus Omnitrophota bacterium]|nr:excinuclease ABC subunit UvrA [Candidatus Omnitrophota bacterium]